MLSYSSLVNSGKVTLPSVDAWSSNLNIMKDPPKSVMTRRKDKVGENNDLLKMIDNSDRSTEAILRFARGVNPSVSVSYSNNGLSTQGFNNLQAKLPYSINKDGDFHPPVQAPQDLLPLSRLPRNTTFTVTKPSMPHYGKELPNSRNVTTTSAVKEEIISAQVRPTKRYYLQRPFQEAFQTDYNIKDVLKKSTSTNVSSGNKTLQEVLVPTKQINNDNLNAFAQSNLSNPIYQSQNNLDPTKFLQDTNAHSVNTNLKDISNGIPLDVDLSNFNTKDVTLIEYTTPLKSNGKTEFIHENFELDRNLPIYNSSTNSGFNKTTNLDFHNDLILDRVLPVYNSTTNIKGNGEHVSYIHDDLELEKNLPEHSQRTNFTKGTQNILKHEYMKDYERKAYLGKMDTNSSGVGDNVKSARKYNLEDKLQLGEYNIPASIPSLDRLSNVNTNFETERVKMNRKAFNLFSERHM